MQSKTVKSKSTERVPESTPVNPGTPDHAFNAERLTRSASTHEKSSTGKEQTFLKEVWAALTLWSPKFAREEMENWGGWWRKRFRENPDKAQRILAEIRAMVRERRILKDPGKAATDLWKRLP